MKWQKKPLPANPLGAKRVWQKVLRAQNGARREHSAPPIGKWLCRGAMRRLVWVCGRVELIGAYMCARVKKAVWFGGYDGGFWGWRYPDGYSLEVTFFIALSYFSKVYAHIRRIFAYISLLLYISDTFEASPWLQRISVHFRWSWCKYTTFSLKIPPKHENSFLNTLLRGFYEMPQSWHFHHSLLPINNFETLVPRERFL